MKTINAFNKIKDFSQKLEKINRNLESSNAIEQLTSVNDLFTGIETLDIIPAFKTIADCFGVRSLISKQIDESEMFSTWCRLMTERANNLEELKPDFGKFKVITKMGFYAYNNIKSLNNSDSEKLKNATHHIINGTQHLTSLLEFLPMAVEMFEMFILPNMTESELQPEVEYLPFNLN
jgi:hypothetical protein